MRVLRGLVGILDFIIVAAGLCVMANYLHENNGTLAKESVLLAVFLMVGSWILLTDSRKKPLVICIISLVICAILSIAGINQYEEYVVYSTYAGACAFFSVISVLLAILGVVKSNGDERSPYSKNLSPVISINGEKYDLYKETLSLPIGGKRGYIAQFYDDIEILGIWTPAKWFRAPQLIPISYNQIRGCKLNRKRNRDYILGDTVSQLYAVLTVEGIYGPTLYVNFMPLQSKPSKESSRAYARCLTDADKFVSKVELIKGKSHKYNR